VEADPSLGGVSLEVGSRVADLQSHRCPPVRL
jgi:hypothetical protein